MSTKQAILSVIVIVILVGVGVFAQSLIRGKQHEDLAYAMEEVFALQVTDPEGAKVRLEALADRAAYLASREPFLGIELLQGFARMTDDIEFDSAGVPNSPPYIYWTVAPSQGNVNESLRFSTWIADVDDHQVRYKISWGDGSANESNFRSQGYGGEAYHQWSTPGQYTVTAQAWDDNGISSSEQSFPLTIVGQAAHEVPSNFPPGPDPEPEPGNPVVCTQVITYGQNPYTNTCVAFPTPCDVPSGWAQCDVESVDEPPSTAYPERPGDPGYPEDYGAQGSGAGGVSGGSWIDRIVNQLPKKPLVNSRPEFIDIDISVPWYSRRNHTAKFEISARDENDSDNLTFTIEWGDGTSVTRDGEPFPSYFNRFDSLDNAYAVTAKHNYPGAGRYLARIIVEDPHSGGVGTVGYREVWLNVTVR